MRALCTPKEAPPPAEPAETVNFFFIEDGEEIPATAAIGTSLLEAAHENDVDLEGAAHTHTLSHRPRVSTWRCVSQEPATILWPAQHATSYCSRKSSLSWMRSMTRRWTCSILPSA